MDRMDRVAMAAELILAVFIFGALVVAFVLWLLETKGEEDDPFKERRLP
jgi:hypothetical protein